MTMTNERIFVLWDVEKRRRVDVHIAADRPQPLQRIAQLWTMKAGRKFTVKTLAEVEALMRQSTNAQIAPTETE